MRKINIKTDLVCGQCLHNKYCQYNYDYQCKKVAKYFFVWLLSL